MIDEKPDILDRWQTTIIYGIRAIWVFAIVAAAIGLSGCTPPLPPAPNPPEPDPHPVDPTPVVDGFRVLIIEETEQVAAAICGPNSRASHIMPGIRTRGVIRPAKLLRRGISAWHRQYRDQQHRSLRRCQSRSQNPRSHDQLRRYL